MLNRHSFLYCSFNNKVGVEIKKLIIWCICHKLTHILFCWLLQWPNDRMRYCLIECLIDSFIHWKMKYCKMLRNIMNVSKKYIAYFLTLTNITPHSVNQLINNPILIIGLFFRWIMRYNDISALSCPKVKSSNRDRIMITRFNAMLCCA